MTVLAGSRSWFWWCNLWLLFISSFLRDTNCNVLTTITSSQIDQSFGCQERPLILTCSTNAPNPSWTLNGDGFYFFTKQPQVLTRDSVSASFLASQQSVSFLSLTIQNFTTRIQTIECGAVGNYTSYPVRHAEIPQAPTNIKVNTHLRNMSNVVLGISWSVQSPTNYDLEHYLVTVNEMNIKAKETNLVVVTSVATEMEVIVSVSVTTVDKCGHRSAAGSTQFKVQAFVKEETVAGTAQPIVDDDPGVSCTPYIISTIVVAVLFIVLLVVGVVSFALLFSCYRHQRCTEGKYVTPTGFTSTEQLKRDSP